MHRQRTKFSQRVNRVFTHRADGVAKALGSGRDPRDLRAARPLLSNRSSRGRFIEAPTQLGRRAGGHPLRGPGAGFTVRPFQQVVPDEAEWRALVEQRDRFVASTEADLAAGGEHVRVRPGKEFVVRLQSYGVELGLDDPWFRVVASHRLLDLANAYLEMWSKLEYVDVWYSVPQPAAAERISSQRWHRDYDDKHLLKVFLYLVDVDEQMGPFQFVAGSQPGGQYGTPGAGRPSGRTTRPRRSWRPASRRGRADLHGARRHARLLQHRGLPPRRLLDHRSAGARHGDVLLARLARVADGAELRVLGRARRLDDATRFALS